VKEVETQLRKGKKVRVCRSSEESGELRLKEEEKGEN
jgi:hypothetical protein